MIFKAFVCGSILGKRNISKALDGRESYVAIGVDILVVLAWVCSLDAQRIMQAACVIKNQEWDLVIEVPVSEISLGQLPLKSR